MITDEYPRIFASPSEELEILYEISRLVPCSEGLVSCLDRLVRLARSILIFDNVVLYGRREDGLLEPTYARAIGRGRCLEADLAWGEVTALEVYRTGQLINHLEELPGCEQDRNKIRYFLGLPLHLNDEIEGILVFIRFGGPVYTQEQVYLAERLALHVAQLLEYHRLVERVANLEAQRRLDTLQDDFIAMISHDLLTPLGFIKGYATTLLRKDITWDVSSQAEFLKIIDEEADRLKELIDRLLDSSRLQAGTLLMNFQLLKLDTFLEEVLRQVMVRDETLKLTLDIRVEDVFVQADPARLMQVFDNLLNNALKYAPGSPILITLERVDHKACIRVRDYGPGIPTKHLDDIFQRFYRLPHQALNVRGTGLGLYICRQIMLAHQGEIYAESTIGQGTVFTIYLPLYDSLTV